MPRPLTNPEMVLLQQETDYLGSGIPVGGSVVVNWNGMYVLIYHSANAGYQTTDVSDLPATTITELAKWTPSESILYYVPQEVAATIEADAETAIEAVKAVGGTAAQISASVATAIGTTLNNLLSPVVQALMVPLVIVGIVLALYFVKK